jgi:hypothetical protein
MDQACPIIFVMFVIMTSGLTLDIFLHMIITLFDSCGTSITLLCIESTDHFSNHTDFRGGKSLHVDTWYGMPNISDTFMNVPNVRLIYTA